MSKKLNNNELKSLGIWHIDLLREAGRTGKHLLKDNKIEKDVLLNLFAALVKNPDQFLTHALLGEIAALAQNVQSPAVTAAKKISEGFASLKTEKVEYAVYGATEIDDLAIKQMDMAMRLPITLAGALMPDAHVGYGLPIGGVLATEADKIIPYAVGVDIACRMCLSVFDIEANYYLDKKTDMLKSFLGENTLFGMDGKFNKPNSNDEVFENPAWNATKLIRDLRYKAINQLGTSGTGNHFVEWGIVEISENISDNPIHLPKGAYLALLSHSGSRGFGATIANFYSKLAMEKIKLPAEARHLAWLDLDTDAGQEYWIAMNLAGEYASANHHQIHRLMATSLGVQPAVMVENHHNFAWKEQLADGREVMVHRKGATPAAKGDIGIIPASMAQTGFVVRGKGIPQSIFSASHGAGRLMSRTKARNSVTKADLKQILKEKGVTLIGGDLDEAPMVYKNIFKVMENQQDLVEILASFKPKIVRMAEPDPRGRRED